MLSIFPASNFSELRLKLRAILCQKLDLSIREAQAEISWIYAEVIGVKSNPLMEEKRPISKSDQERLEKILLQRLQFIPLAYIMGYSWFYGYRFEVSDQVLIPRPESELLIDQAKAILSDYHNPRLLEIGTGSGCLAITMALELKDKHPYVVATDLSKEALTLARSNALYHKVVSYLDFYHCDITPRNSERLHYDLVISNPPYISAQEHQGLSLEVHKEPVQALVGDMELNNTGLYYYERVAELIASDKLLTDHLLLEVDPNRADRVWEIYEPLFEEYNFIDDYNGLKRFLKLSGLR
ncbi:MAG: HemK/PrmC family methyltransferase [Candidatus Caenarcaniphilales bacterium]|nr:HemK/PrmC family methyltransferase [Candidatus Caenarcaniphilales bacterium]